jgi:preprotein translocase subunit SecA
MPEDTPLEYKQVTKAIQSAQAQVEAQNFEIRKDVLKYDEVMNKQRTVIYDERRKVLDGVDLSGQVRAMIDDVVRGYVEGATAEGYAEDWDLEQLWTALKTLYPISLTIDEAIETAGGKKSDLTRDFLIEEIVADAHAAYDEREELLGADVLREVERRVLLSVMDRKWREHLYEMDYLQEGIGLRAMGQRDPLVEYKREGFDMFAAMMEAIKEESVGFVFNLEVEMADEDSAGGETEGEGAELDAAGVVAALAATNAPSPRITARGLDRNENRSKTPLTYTAPDLDTNAPEVRVEAAADTTSTTASARRQQQARANPNRGSRGSRGHARSGRKRRR